MAVWSNLAVGVGAPGGATSAGLASGAGFAAPVGEAGVGNGWVAAAAGWLCAGAVYFSGTHASTPSGARTRSHAMPPPSVSPPMTASVVPSVYAFMRSSRAGVRRGNTPSPPVSATTTDWGSDARTGAGVAAGGEGAGAAAAGVGEGGTVGLLCPHYFFMSEKIMNV